MVNQIDMNSEWDNTLRLLAGLFPRWTVTEEQLSAWKLEFGMFNPIWLRESIHLVYSRYSSDHPRPKWIQQAFKEIRAKHTGVELNPSISASLSYEKMRQISESDIAEAEADQERMYQNVKSWDNDQRIQYAERFKKRFPVLKTRNKSEDFSTWSKTFAGFVYSFRKIEKELRK